MPGQPKQANHQHTAKERGAPAARLLRAALVIGLFWGLFWGCGTDQPIEPAATSSTTPPSVDHSGGEASTGSMTAEAVDPEKVQQAMTFQQQVQETDPATLQEVLLDGVASADPNIQLMALNQLEPMLAWNAQARSDLENMLQHETDPGMRRRMEDLLAKEVAPVLQSADASAAPN